MSRIRVSDVDKAKWEKVRDVARPEDVALFTDAELDSVVCFHEPGTENSPQLFEVKYLPHAAVHLHAHDQDEIIYILDGEMHVGNRVLKPGSSLYVQGGTLYQFSAGSDGMRMLNFRPCIDLSYILVDEFKERQKRKARTAG